VARDYRAEYRRRNQRARSQGYRSYGTKRRSNGVLDAREEEARYRALDALALMRRDGLSLGAAARQAHTTAAMVRRFAGAALDESRRPVRARPWDRLPRQMRVLAAGGVVEVTVTSSQRASIVGHHWVAVRTYLHVGDVRVLEPFRGVTVAGVELESDPDAIDELARRGRFDFSSIYTRVE
jgi:hypothetical protein